MSEELKALISQRGLLKAQLTRFVTFVDNLAIDKSKISEISRRLSKLDLVWNSFNEVQTKIELLDSSAETLEEREIFENKYFESVSRAEKYSLMEHTQTSILNVTTRNVTLPQIKLPEFTGEYENWFSFYDTFKTLVDDDKGLNNIQKYHYLQASLKGEAADVIRSLLVSEENYPVALDLLKSRFENKKIIRRSHLKHIFDLPMVIRNSHTSLREFHDNFQKHFRSLKNLGLPVEQWDAILIYLLTSKLDHNTKQEWEIESNDSNMPTIDSFVAFLSKKCQLLESMNNKPHTSSFNKKPIEYKNYVHASTNESIVCSLCKSNHFLYSCKKFLDMSPQDRYTQVKNIGLCTNCLRTRHSNVECQGKKCKICNKKHNSLLHFQTMKQSQQKIQPSASSSSYQTSSMQMHPNQNEEFTNNKTENHVSIDSRSTNVSFSSSNQRDIIIQQNNALNQPDDETKLDSSSVMSANSNE